MALHSETNYMSDRSGRVHFPDDYLGKVRVGTDTFTCKGGHWHRDADGPGESGCRVDSVMAAAYASGFQRSGDAIRGNDACRRVTPCLTTSDGTDDPEVCYDDASNRMPALLPGDLRCVHVDPEKVKTLERTGRDEMPMGADAKGAQQFAANRVRVKKSPLTPKPLLTRKKALPVAAPPRQEGPPAAPPAPAPKADTSWRKVELFQGSSKLACSKDTDCPVEEPVAFDIWFDSVASHCTNGRPMKVKDMFECATNKLLTTVKHAGTLSDKDKPKTLPQLNEHFRAMYKDDVLFRTSLDAAVMAKKSLREAFLGDKAVSGACDKGACAKARDARANHRLFDGTSDVTFHDTDSGVKFARPGGRMHAVHAVSCDVDDAPAACRDDSLEVIKGGVLRKAQPVRDRYLLEDMTSDAKYLVENRMHVRGDAPRDAAAMACGVAGGECPARYCRRDGARCVPKEDAAGKVKLHKV